MKPEELSLRDLQYVLAVSEYGHFGQAAQACHVSQPSLSIQIQKLEEKMGIQLFERSRRKVLTTEVGKKFVLEAKSLLAQAGQLTKISGGRSRPR